MTRERVLGLGGVFCAAFGPGHHDSPHLGPDGRFASLHDTEGSPVQLWQPT